MQRTYGSVQFKGTTWKDKVCVSDKWCRNDFEFFVAQTQEGQNGSPGLGNKIDGIMGMARPIVPPGFRYELGPSFPQSMSKPKFNFHLATKSKKNGGTSFVDFGNPVAGNMKNPDLNAALYVDLKQDFYWSSMIKAVGFGTDVIKGKNGNFAFTSDPVTNFSGRRTPYKQIYSIFDTGTSFTLIPANYWKPYTEQIIHHFKIEQHIIENGAFAFFCNERNKFKPLRFMFPGTINKEKKDVWLTMNPEDYIIELGNKDVAGGLCALAIRKNKADFFMMGNSFFRGYYAMHDASPNGSLAFTPSSTGGKEAP